MKVRYSVFGIVVMAFIAILCLVIVLAHWWLNAKRGRDFFGRPRPAVTATSVSSEGQPSGTSAFGEHPKAPPGALDSEQ